MKDEYIIINKSNLLRKIEELENFYMTARKVGLTMDVIDREIEILKQILSQSVSLIPEIEKVWETCSKLRSGQNVGIRNKTEYISNLKLDI